ncbi:hypothetical protein GCM10007860_27900 [Chitiniphilus shinanonensis]|uniref:Chitin-binding type-3 domain-containing protein n=1 Tax=Chitiniphilus shinanonensis TaxID=553088 RepID=A0ABQ6BUG1_9NEIS|nr:carbohydrate-binding protein [Chitiniphilus shinanonensis]GLS05633.1 hypothetical protein GCM10007860_27900 [Chitiniphilus shinanonensis]
MRRPFLAALLTTTLLVPAFAAPPLPEWREGDGYLIGVTVQYQGQTYRALQSHTAQKGANWNPASTPALWQLHHGPVQRCSPWQAGYSYQLGDQIRYEGDYYRARQAHTAHAGTEWQPPRVPALWQPIAQCDAVTPVPPGNTDTINGIKVPPDPGAAGRKTLAGIDADHDGVRDDVQRFLAQEVGKHPARFKYAMEMARITQQEILTAGGNDREEARRLANQGDLPLSCFHDTFNSSVEDYEWRLKYSKKLAALHANTPERMAAIIKNSELLGGMMFHSPMRYRCE